MGITHTQGTNFYLNPCDEDGSEVTPVWKDGTAIEILEIPAPKKHKSPASSRVKPPKAPKPSSNVVSFARK